MILVDSHCHLNFPDFADDLDQVVDRAREAGVRYMQTISTDLKEFKEVSAIASRYEGVFCSVGVHPNNVAEDGIPDVQDIIERTSGAKVIGIGETGLDYHYEHSPRDAQKISFINHIRAAQETGLPVIVHDWPLMPAMPPTPSM